jgi:hypothetical protein
VAEGKKGLPGAIVVRGDRLEGFEVLQGKTLNIFLAEPGVVVANFLVHIGYDTPKEEYISSNIVYLSSLSLGGCF